MAVEVERLVLRPDAIDDRKPLLGIVVAAVVVTERDAHHAELDRIPAGDDVEPEPAVTDMVGGHHLLRGKHRIDEGDMQRAERGDVVRRGQQSARPGDRLKRGALGVALALIAVPAPDRQQEFEPGLVGELRRLDVIVPRCIPAFRRLGETQAALAVHAEQAELELVLVVDASLVAAARHLHSRFRSSRALRVANGARTASVTAGYADRALAKRPATRERTCYAANC